MIEGVRLIKQTYVLIIELNLNYKLLEKRGRTMNQVETPKWATQNDLEELELTLSSVRSNPPLHKLTDEERDHARNIVISHFWNELEKKRKKN